MSDEEDSDEEIILDPSREQQISQDVNSNLEQVLNQKTVNFEELLNELVKRRCLSFEEKFKILSGIIDENTSNKTLPEKCNELYHTLIRKQIPWAKVLKCWEETGNNYLVGRFDTHFSIEGRDSKSLKFSKFKALPSHRTEFLTHLRLRNLQLSPKSLLKCLRKSSRLESIRLERVKVPYGGRFGDDPSSDFDVPLLLPNLKEFYLEEVTKQEPLLSIKDINTFVDELNLKPMLFFGLNSNMAWDAGIFIHIIIRGVNVLKMKPIIFVESDSNQNQGETTTSEFISMLRRRPVEFGGFINPENCPRISLYECYLPKLPFTSKLTHLILYRCKITSFDPLISVCPNLVSVSLYGEFETNNVPQLDLSSLTTSRDSLKEISIGFLHLFNAYENPISDLCLDSLTIDCCKCEDNFIQNIPQLFKSVIKTCLIACSVGLLNSFVTTSVSNDICVGHFTWDQENETDFNNVFNILHKGLKGNESHFIMTRSDSSWITKKFTGDLSAMLFELFHWNTFCNEGNRKSWFDLPFKETTDEIEKDPRKFFRNGQKF